MQSPYLRHIREIAEGSRVSVPAVVYTKIEESEKAGSRQESNPGYLACAASALSLSCDSWTTGQPPALTILSMYFKGATEMPQSHI